MTGLFVDKKGFHKSIVMHELPPTYNIPWQMTPFDYYNKYDPSATVQMTYSTFKLQNYVEGTNNQVGLYKEI